MENSNGILQYDLFLTLDSFTWHNVLGSNTCASVVSSFLLLFSGIPLCVCKSRETGRRLVVVRDRRKGAWEITGFLLGVMEMF